MSGSSKTAAAGVAAPAGTGGAASGGAGAAAGAAGVSAIAAIQLGPMTSGPTASTLARHGGAASTPSLCWVEFKRRRQRYFEATVTAAGSGSPAVAVGAAFGGKAGRSTTRMIGWDAGSIGLHAGDGSL
jgi:hypothetical protein